MSMNLIFIRLLCEGTSLSARTLFLTSLIHCEDGKDGRTMIV